MSGRPNAGPEYDAQVREEIAATLSLTPPGEWAELALCPGPYGCPFQTLDAALDAGAEAHPCDGCRVIRLYRAACP